MRTHGSRPTLAGASAVSGGSRDGERGQIMIVFTLVVVLLMALAAIVIDVSLLRTDGQQAPERPRRGRAGRGPHAAGEQHEHRGQQAGRTRLHARQLPRHAQRERAGPDAAIRLSHRSRHGHRAAPRLGHAPGMQRLLRRDELPMEVHDGRVLGSVRSGPAPDRRVQHGHPDVQRDAALLLRARGRRQQRQHGCHHFSRLHRGVRLAAAPARRRRHPAGPHGQHGRLGLGRQPARRRALGTAGVRSRAAAHRTRVHGTHVPDPDDERQLRQPEARPGRSTRRAP